MDKFRTLDSTKNASVTEGLKSSLRENWVGWVTTVAASAVAAMLKWAFPDFGTELANTILGRIESKQLLALLGTALLANFVLLSFFIPMIRRDKIFPKYGVYWDRKGNSYCPKCKSLTSQIRWSTFNNSQWHGLYCECSKLPFVFIDGGQPIHAQNAMARMKPK